MYETRKTVFFTALFVGAGWLTVSIVWPLLAQQAWLQTIEGWVPVAVQIAAAAVFMLMLQHLLRGQLDPSKKRVLIVLIVLCVAFALSFAHPARHCTVLPIVPAAVADMCRFRLVIKLFTRRQATQ